MGFKERLPLVGFQCVRALVRVLPARLAVHAGSLIGGIVGAFCPRERRIAETQMRYIERHEQTLSAHFREKLKKPEKLVHQVFRHAGETIVESLIIDRLIADVDNHVVGKGQDVMLGWVREKKGVLALSGHIGCIELLAAYHIKTGVPVSVVGRMPNYASVATMLAEVRKNYGAEIIWREDEHGARTMLKALRGGRFVAVLLDQDTPLQSTYAPFFGLAAAHPEAPVRLAVRLGIPIFSTFIVRTSTLRHEVRSVPIEYDPNDENVVANILATYAARLQALIEEFPEQWIWWHRRWRRRPGVDYQNQPELLSTNNYLSWLNQS